MSEIVQHVAVEPGPALRAVNMAAAFLGVSSFLGLVHLIVGVLSAGWLCLQAYGYIKYELPKKRAERLRAEFLARSSQINTEPGDLS